MTKQSIQQKLTDLKSAKRDAVFTVETISASQLQAKQNINHPQGFEALTDHQWVNDEGSRKFLEATLGTALS